MSAVADRAGVTRATVYRHFPDEESLFLACSRQWLSRQQLPEPDAWGLIEDPIERLRAGLLDIYGFYRRGEQLIHISTAMWTQCRQSSWRPGAHASSAGWTPS